MQLEDVAAEVKKLSEQVDSRVVLVAAWGTGALALVIIFVGLMCGR